MKVGTNWTLYVDINKYKIHLELKDKNKAYLVLSKCNCLLENLPLLLVMF